MKFVGPTSQFLKAWGLLGMRVLNDFEIADSEGNSFPFIQADRKWLGAKICSLARNQLIKELVGRANEEEGRRDFKGMSWGIDYWATTALLRGESAPNSWKKPSLRSTNHLL